MAQTYDNLISAGTFKRKKHIIRGQSKLVFGLMLEIHGLE